MKQYIHLALMFVLFAVNTRNSLSAPPPPPAEQVLTQVERAFLSAIDEQRAKFDSFLLYDTRLEGTRLSLDGSWALTELIPLDPQSGWPIPVEPGIALANKTGSVWEVFLPTDQKWSQAVKDSPADLLPDTAKTFWLESQTQAIEQLAGLGPFGGYRLPWANGLTMFMTQSVHHDMYTPSLNAHYAFDFAAPGYPSGMFDLYAAKSGTVWMFIDSWENGHYNPNNPNETNFIVLQDTTTSPTTYQLYLHLAQNSIPPDLKVKGTVVRQGQFIGVADDTGVSSGNHLHFHVHASSSSYWGTSIDITFADVAINGGRPRNQEDAAYCRHDTTYNDVCDTFQATYVSGNIPSSDFTPPVGDLLDPLPRATISASSVRLEGWATDEGSGLASAQFLALYDGSWHEISSKFTTNIFSTTWDLCTANVPDGPISLALKLIDRSNNQTLGLPGLRHITKNFSCPIQPPACQPASSQVAVFNNPDFTGACQLFGSGIYTTSAALGSQLNNAESILIGSSVQATLYNSSNLRSRGETFTSSDSNLLDNRTGSNSLLSLRVMARSAAPLAPIAAWPSNNAAFPINSSISLLWDDGGGAKEYLARWDGPGGPITRTWQSSAMWNLGSLSQGSYTWKVKSRNPSGESAWSSIAAFNIQASENDFSETGSLIAITAPYTDTFDNGYGAWTWSSNWDQTAAENHTPGGLASWTYDVSNAVIGYDNGQPNMGDLTSPEVYLPAGATNYLSFFYVYETEGKSPIWDQRWVQISSNNGPFTYLYQLSDDTPNTWLQSPKISLAAYQGNMVRIRFHFETLDNVKNAYRGWFIDDFRIKPETLAVCSEPSGIDDQPTNARLLAYNAYQDGMICSPGDVDYFKFNANAGDQVGLFTRAASLGSLLDTHLSLLDADGSSLLAENDDQVLYQIPDSALTYLVKRTGTYYVKIRAWDHPGSGGNEFNYSIHLVKDSLDPQAVFSAPVNDQYIPRAPIVLTITAADTMPGISHIEFYWHSSDWLASDWTFIGDDWNGADGWSEIFDAGGIPYQKGLAFYARVYDWAGNWVGTGVWNLTNSRNLIHLPVISR